MLKNYPTIEQIEWVIKDLKRWRILEETFYDMGGMRETDIAMSYFRKILDLLNKKKRIPEKVLKQLQREAEFCKRVREESIKEVGLL